MKPLQHSSAAASLVVVSLLANVTVAFEPGTIISILVTLKEPIIGILALKDPIISIAVGLWAWATGGGKIFCYFKECCEPGSEWISFNRSGLVADLHSKLFGQHIASLIILEAVSGFMSNNNRQTPLVLSLHGWTGTGKNLVSKLIAKNSYKEGMDSKYVHLFDAKHHFPHDTLIHTYESQLRQWIKGNVTDCATSMFIFDEVDKMPPGLIDSIKPFLDYHDKLDGVSYRKAIFIFLSNAGGDIINTATLAFWNAARDREEIQLKDMETALSEAVFNNKQSGLWRTNLIDKNLVDFFVPFLPLEYKHVVRCVMAEMATRGLVPDHDMACKVAKELAYFPKTERAFSVKGCKTIQSRLDFYLAYYQSQEAKGERFDL